MKTKLAALIISTVSLWVNASEVLEVNTISVHGNEIQLSKYLQNDGQVCVEYINSSSKEAEGEWILVDKICGKRHNLPNGLGGMDVYPKNLISMRFNEATQSHDIKVE